VKFKTRKEIQEAAKAANLDFLELISGPSPYSSFDMILSPKDSGFNFGVTPANYVKSEVPLVSSDPATCYRGRHGKGRLFMATLNEGGDVFVNAGSGDAVAWEFANGTTVGHKTAFTIGDLF